MSNPNTVTVYSPEGEPFEMSRINARDLCAHRGWSMSPLTSGKAPAPKKEAEDAAADSAGSVEDAATEITETEAPAEAEAEVVEEAVEEAVEEVTAEAGVKVFTTADEFDELTTREDVVAYLAAAFPDFKPHHKSSRDGLIAKAIELAAG